MKLDEIYEQNETENSHFECKVKLDRNNALGWLKTVDGFANNKGGILLLGVEDKTNTLIGFDVSEIDKEKLYFHKEIKEHFDVLPLTSVSLLPYVVNEKKRYLIEIKVLESDMKPVILKYQGLPLIFMRRDGFTSAATSEEIIDMTLEGNKPKYDEGVSDVKFDFDDFKTLRKFYFENVGRELKEKELLSLGFISNEGYLKNGALLFKDDYDGNKTTVVCSNFNGNTRGDNFIVSSNKFQGNLISCYKYIIEFVEQRMNHGFIKEKDRRIDIDAFPKRSVFETTINALAHRDYFLDGTSIYVDLFNNRLSVSSPGGLFQTGELQKTYKLESFISKRRNELISSVFVLCKAMEAKGTGFEKIIDDYKNADAAHKPFIFSKNNQFSIILPDLTNPSGVNLDDESIKLMTKPVSQSKYDNQILAYCYTGSKSVKEIIEYLGISNSTFFRKKILGDLINQGYLLETEGSKGKEYKTNHELVSVS